MAKTISPALKAHYAQGSTTISRQWKATRKDGVILAVTTCTRDLMIDGVLYLAAEGFNPRAVQQEASTAVANTEIAGALQGDLTELEFEAGLWDGCEVEIFEVNYRDLSMGRLYLGTMTMGNVSIARGSFQAEMRGLTQSLQKTVGRVVTAGCPWKFGDPDTCRVDLAPLTVTGTLTSVTDLRTFSDSGRTEVDDYFGAGVITFDTGENAGQSLEIYSYDGTTKTFVTHLPLINNPAIGDTYTVTPGCRKRFQEDCKTKWANVVNFGGFPYLPGNDRAMGLGGTEGSSL